MNLRAECELSGDSGELEQSTSSRTDGEIASEIAEGTPELGALRGFLGESRAVSYAGHENIVASLVQRHRTEQIKIIANFKGVRDQEKKQIANITSNGWFPTDNLVQILQGLADSGDRVGAEHGRESGVFDGVTERPQQADLGSDVLGTNVATTATPQSGKGFTQARDVVSHGFKLACAVFYLVKKQGRKLRSLQHVRVEVNKAFLFEGRFRFFKSRSCKERRVCHGSIVSDRTTSVWESEQAVAA